MMTLPIYGSVFPVYATNSTVLQNTNFSSPLEQFLKGIQVNNIQCNNGMQLIIKAEDGSPACVKPDTASILVERGWAKETSSQTPSNIVTTFAACDTSYPPNVDGLPVGKGFPLLYMPSNSIGSICVNYYDIIDSGSVGFHIFKNNSSCFVCKNNPTGITISASKNYLSGASTNETVVYTIKTGNYSGLFGISTFCESVYLAVGYENVSNITHGNFTWTMYGSKACPAAFYYDSISGLHGIGFKFIH